jgi:hypothetical protein
MSAPAWSYSALKTFEQCPKRYYHEKVAKDYVQGDTDATIYGKAVHSAAELYVRDRTPIPEKYAYIKPMIDKLLAIKGHKLAEYEMGIAKQDGRLVPCAFGDDNRWWRGIADLLILNGDTAYCIDYKTSKNAKYADTKQLALLAAAVFLHFPQVKKVKGALLFVVCDHFIKESYAYDDRFAIFAKLDSLLQQRDMAYDSGVFNPKTSGLCKRHCQVLACPHNGRN